MTKILIMGAAGRDFHNFNVAFRDDPACEVVAFTATQIPNIEGRTYPRPSSQGLDTPTEFRFFRKPKLDSLDREICRRPGHVCLQRCRHTKPSCIRHRSRCAAGADFRLMGPKATLLKSTKPVVAICAVRTGSGKSQTITRRCGGAKENGQTHRRRAPSMPYGELAKQAVQRFATMD